MKRTIEIDGYKVPDIRGGANLNSPIPAEWADYVTQSPIALEVIPDVIYDTVTYTDNVSTELVLFTTQRATKDLSNLTTAGMLPNPQSFLIQAVRVYFKSIPQIGTTSIATLLSDIALLVNTGILTLTIGAKLYGPFPLWMFSAGSFPDARLAGAGAEATDEFLSYAQLGGPLMSFFPHLMLSPLQNFQCNLNWPAGAVDLTGNQVIEVVLEGQRARAVN